jgi:ABC-type Na+ efflux pump permease subunit
MKTIRADGTTSTDAITSIASYAWTLTKPGSTTVTKTTSTVEFSSDDTNEVGSYTLALTVTDQAGNTNACTSKTATVQSSDGDKKVIVAQNDVKVIKNQKNTAVMVLVGLAFLVVVCVLLAVILIASKKK